MWVPAFSLTHSPWVYILHLLLLSLVPLHMAHSGRESFHFFRLFIGLETHLNDKISYALSSISLQPICSPQYFFLYHYFSNIFIYSQKKICVSCHDLYWNDMLICGKEKKIVEDTYLFIELYINLFWLLTLYKQPWGYLYIYIYIYLIKLLSKKVNLFDKSHITDKWLVREILGLAYENLDLF